jgi:sodium-dependent dicarboxylate transporter 2/3/5
LTDEAQNANGLSTNIALLAGPLVAIVLFFLLPENYVNQSGVETDLSLYARFVASVALWMAVWWITEPIPVYATSLLPLALFPLAGGQTIKQVAASYGHELIYLFLGGFIVALGLERWGLHRRIALTTLAAVGSRPVMIVGAFMVIAASLSMWVTNTATTIMLMPVALSVISLLDSDAAAPDGKVHELHGNFSLCLLLSIAYAASIGGIGTIIGTAPNLFVVSFLQEQTGERISFVEWMQIGVPLVIVFVPCAWLLMTRLIYPLSSTPIPGAQDLLSRAAKSLSPICTAEKRMLLVFFCTALAWIFRPLINRIDVFGMQPLGALTDSGIAVVAALILFVTPAANAAKERLMDWPTALRLPWGLLLLLGGGLALANGIDSSGFSLFLGSGSGLLKGFPIWMVLLFVVAAMIFLTELTSNTATTATLIPVLYAVAIGLGIKPELIVVPAAIAASCAFMLPVATPPNAIIFGSGLIRVRQMSRAGFYLNLLGIVLVSSITYAILLLLL